MSNAATKGASAERTGFAVTLDGVTKCFGGVDRHSRGTPYDQTW